MPSDSPSESENEKKLEKRAPQGPPEKRFQSDEVRETDGPRTPGIQTRPRRRDGDIFYAPAPKKVQEELRKMEQSDPAEGGPDKGSGMSSDPTSDEQPEVDDETLSEVVRRPTRTAGDLSEVADASSGITTEDLARDLEAVASKQGVPTESELLADLLRRMQRIEEHLGITN